ncbi:MAG: hypothetical protein ACRCVT_16760, partial [Leadbetterella sp.]
MKLFVLTVLSVFFMACGSDSESVEPKSVLEGSWNWVQSTGGIAGITLKSSDKESKMMVFKADGTFDYFV